ncbi:MAG: hypothetical protein JWO37_412 [Acidimicrobiales bacterium]|jgi:hypothetical protein|nr:hypothetical protein [Acidimicrobiales bacterium]
MGVVFGLVELFKEVRERQARRRALKASQAACDLGAKPGSVG